MLLFVGRVFDVRCLLFTVCRVFGCCSMIVVVCCSLFVVRCLLLVVVGYCVLCVVCRCSVLWFVVC